MDHSKIIDTFDTYHWPGRRHEWGFSDSNEEMLDADGGEAAGGDADEEMPDFGVAGDGDGWGSSIEFEITNTGVILMSSGDEE